MIELHASEIHKWLSCPQSAVASKMVPCQTMKEFDVGVHFGNEVHREITGHEYNYKGRIKYDDTTRHDVDYETSLTSAVSHVEQYMNDNGWEVTEKETFMKMILKVGEEDVELIGTSDMIVKCGDDVMLVDIKTGTHPPANAWTQLMFYGWLRHHIGRLPNVNKLAILWIPRKRILKYEDLQLDVRDWFEGWVPEIEEMVKHATLVMLGRRMAYYNPSSSNCRYCVKEDCAMRWQYDR